MENRLPHVSWVVFRDRGAQSRQFVAEDVVECAKGRVLGVCGAIGDARLHGTIEGSGEYFRLRLEFELDGSL